MKELATLALLVLIGVVVGTVLNEFLNKSQTWNEQADSIYTQIVEAGGFRDSHGVYYRVVREDGT